MTAQLWCFGESGNAYKAALTMQLSGFHWEPVFVDFFNRGTRTPEFRAINPMGAVPALVLDDGTVLTQSLAILEWIEETYPAPPLLPQGAAARARVRALCALTAADTHPLVVPRVQGYLSREWGLDEPKRIAWNAHWFRLGLQGYETLLADAGPFCAGEALSFADACLASHVAGAERFKVDLAPFPAVRAIHDRCIAMPEFARAHPLRQPGASA